MTEMLGLKGENLEQICDMVSSTVFITKLDPSKVIE